jgi:hypothetical protein
MGDAMLECKLIKDDDFKKATEERIKLARSRTTDDAWKAANKATYGWASMHEIVGYGVMWYMPWYYSPTDPGCMYRREAALQKMLEGQSPGHLSRYYWQDWSDKRPPLCVICPNGVEWIVDAKSSNGDGWVVQGDAPKLRVHPSILVPGYHGWLGTNGVPPGWFSNDLDGRGAYGERR